MNLGSHAIHIEREVAYDAVQFGSRRVIALEPDFDENRSGWPGSRINRAAIPGIEDEASGGRRRDRAANGLFSLSTQARCTSETGDEYRTEHASNTLRRCPRFANFSGLFPAFH